MKRRPNHYELRWEGETLEQLGPIWARLGLDPSISTEKQMAVGDVVHVKEQAIYMVIAREIGKKERATRRRLMGFAPSDLPYCYAVLAD